MQRRSTVLALCLPLLLVTACKDKHVRVSAGGSSTVYPITEAMAEEFGKERQDIKVTVGISGTGGGFKKFCAGETDLCDASRPIKQAEMAACAKAGVAFIEVPVAYDGIAVVVNPKNTWADHITLAELKALFEPGAQGKVTRWSQIRAGWPDREIHLYAPGIDSGTYDYFTSAVVGREQASRGDYTSSEDDNVLVHGVATDELALGFFGLAYYAENRERLKILPIDDGVPTNGDGPIAPTMETIRNGTYQPLSRPVFIYVATKSLGRPEVQAFMEYYLRRGTALIDTIGYVALPERAYQLGKARLDAKTTGSIFVGGSQVGVSIDQLLEKASTF